MAFMYLIIALVGFGTEILLASQITSPSKNLCSPICQGALHPKTWEPAKVSQEQVEKNIDIFLNTVFPKKRCSMGSTKKPSSENQKSLFLKRLFFMLSKHAKCRFLDGKESNLCGFPVALMMGQGGRVLIETEGVSSDQILNWLSSGNPNHHAKFVKNRLAASHGIAVTDEGFLQEIKLTGFKGTAKNLWNGLRKRHHYINIALGGVGNLAPIASCDEKKSHLSTLKKQTKKTFLKAHNKLTPSLVWKKNQPTHSAQLPKCAVQCLINEEGEVYNTVLKKNISDVQHGHIYIFAQDFKKKNELKGGLLIGLENSAPGKRNFWGVKHDAKSASADLSGARSATGGKKLSLLLAKAPLALGGIVVKLSKENFENVKNSYQDFSEEEFKKILKNPPLSNTP